MNNDNTNNENDTISTEPSPFDLPYLPPAPQLPQQHGQAEAPVYEEPQSPLMM
jgi:hypothetical protein